jgi:hypothetical protein
MSRQHRPVTRITAAWVVWALVCFPFSQAAPPASPVVENAKACEDTITTKVQVDPKLKFKFFTAPPETSRPWHIVGNADDGLEDTLDGNIDEEDLILLEHTSACISTHQGEHPMTFCEAKSTSDATLSLLIHGGVPAYTSGLTVNVDAKSGDFTCAFDALYPSPTLPLTWRITKKTMRAKSLDIHPGHRFYAWISVEFDEVWMENGKEQKRPYKIEGPIKPVIQHPPKKE